MNMLEGSIRTGGGSVSGGNGPKNHVCMGLRKHQTRKDTFIKLFIHVMVD